MSMSRILFAFLLAAAWIDGHAQSSLPPCPTSAPTEQWTECVGTKKLTDKHPSATYTGEFKNGVPEGHGTMIIPGERYNLVYKSPPTEYVGQWREGVRHGYGVLRGPYNYEGEWENDLQNGWGEESSFALGRKIQSYVGQFKDGQKTGFGTFKIDTVFKKQTLQGLWFTNIFVGEKSEAQFRYEQDLKAQEKVRAEKRELLTKLLSEIDASLLQIEREAQERRIEIEGDGSEDDQTCKSRKLKPSTAPYKKCRSDLVAIREARLLKEKQLAEMREAKRLEQARIAQRQKEKQEQAEIERQRLLALQREKAQEAAERRDRQREEAAAKDPFFFAKEQCKELGFKEKTEKFGTCVLDLSKRSGFQPESSGSNVARSDGSPDDKTCIGYGYAIGTTGYADCRLKLDQARQQYERELTAYEAEKAEYDRRAAAIKRENELRAAEALTQYGLCFASCGTDYLSCATRCGSGSAGVDRSAGPAPVQPSGFSTYILNGKIINCSRLGSIVTCN